MHESRDVRLDVTRYLQPDEVTCGPSSLLSVLRFHGRSDLGIADVVAATPRNPDGGTLAPHLGRAAQAFGFSSRMRPLAVKVFDPSWTDLPPEELLDRLDRRTEGLPQGSLRRVHEAWRAYLSAGGEVVLGELRTGWLMAALDRGHPLIAGLCLTWLYQHPREIPETNEPDDIVGMPVGHFVVITGYADGGDTFFVSDPWPHPPFLDPHATDAYPVNRRRLHQAILLGDATHDAVVIEVLPPMEPK